MTFVLILIGAALSAAVCGGVFEEPTAVTAAILGGCIGLLLGQLRHLRARLAEFEKQVAAMRIDLVTSKFRDAVVRTPAESTPDILAAHEMPAPTIVSAAEPITPIAPTFIAATSAAEVSEQPTQTSEPPAIETIPRAPAQPDVFSIAVERVKRWFTEGNVPVKVGVIVLFLGVAALLKYAADAGWLRVPIEVRLAGVALAALAALGFAWRKRESNRPFALSLQGGAIGILIITVYTAFHTYALLPAAMAFALLIVIVAGAGVLAVAQDALALAILAILAGFLAPILAASDQGNHVVLFGYYAVLNAMIFAVAWVRPWRALNVLGFVFTFGIGTLWGVLKYRPELFASTEPFLLLFFAFYLFIPVLYARRQADPQRDLIDSTLVFGMPLAAFPLQAALLDGARMPLAFIALAAAVIYMSLAAFEIRRLALRLLGQSHALLALGFATLAVPLALSARATACAWALEGAALVWLGLRQNRKLPRWIGYALQGGAAFSFVYGFDATTDATPILNGEFFSALLIAIGGGATAWLIFRADRQAPLATASLVWAWAWWWCACARDIDRFAPPHLQSDWALALVAVTGAFGALVYRRLNWPAAAWPVFASLVAAAPLIVFTTIDNHGPLEHWAAAAWALWLVTTLFSLQSLAVRQHSLVHAAQLAFLCLVALVFSAELEHLAYAHFGLGELWVALVALVPTALLFWLTLRRYKLVRWPDDAAAERTRFITLCGASTILMLAWIAGLFFDGDPAPLPYVPAINPLELPQIGFLLLLLLWYRQAAREGEALTSPEARARLLAIAGFVLLTAITLRSAHFLGGVPWSDALWQSALAQAALSIVWTVAGIAAMLLGKRRGSRAVWIGGGTLMGVVILKLILIDRQHLHDLTAIVGVLVVGILLVGVGYFAPVPPRTKSEAA
ncbi:MAG TPA: DUF2339 domain-containing protein [Rudaea sp.]|nr:DUF2339 domain-containing protein [Rudaea sp.]